MNNEHKMIYMPVLYYAKSIAVNLLQTQQHLWAINKLTKGRSSPVDFFIYFFYYPEPREENRKGSSARSCIWQHIWRSAQKESIRYVTAVPALWWVHLSDGPLIRIIAQSHWEWFLLCSWSKPKWENVYLLGRHVLLGSYAALLIRNEQVGFICELKHRLTKRF